MWFYADVLFFQNNADADCTTDLRMFFSFVDVSCVSLFTLLFSYFFLSPLLYPLSISPFLPLFLFPYFPLLSFSSFILFYFSYRFLIFLSASLFPFLLLFPYFLRLTFSYIFSQLVIPQLGRFISVGQTHWPLQVIKLRISIVIKSPTPSTNTGKK